MDMTIKIYTSVSGTRSENVEEHQAARDYALETIAELCRPAGGETKS